MTDARARATLVGASTILMFAALAPLAATAGAIPPFQTVAMAFAVAFGVGLLLPVLRGRPLGPVFRQPPRVWALGVYGLFGYHFAYFTALRHAPPLEANLLNYLWPLLIVLFSALVPGERLRWHHLAGAALGLAGCAALILGGPGRAGAAGTALGYAAAVSTALIWSSYSVASRRLGAVPTDAVGGFCGVTAVLAAACHLALETTAWPTPPQALAILAMGLGPMGLAFFTWDHGCKHGDIRVLGALAYATPLLSTAAMIAFGFGAATPRVGVAALLIVGGACLATREFWAKARGGGASPGR